MTCWLIIEEIDGLTRRESVLWDEDAASLLQLDAKQVIHTE